MVDVITYRTTDNSRWGGGLGADLDAATIDINFWVLASQLAAVQDHITNIADIDYFNITGNLLYVHLTNHVVLGPYTLPTAQWNPRGEWVADTIYAAFDVVTNNNAVYLVSYPHTSAGSFDAGDNDGMGHDYYMLLLSAPTNTVPAGGTTAQRLAKASGIDYDFAWVTDYRNLALFASGAAGASELLLQYLAVETLTLPISLTGSSFKAATNATADTTFTLHKNGASIGTIKFPAGGAGSVTVTFPSAITLAPDDEFTVTAPATPDSTLADVTLSFKAAITG